MVDIHHTRDMDITKITEAFAADALPSNDSMRVSIRKPGSSLVATAYIGNRGSKYENITVSTSIDYGDYGTSFCESWTYKTPAGAIKRIRAEIA